MLNPGKANGAPMLLGGTPAQYGRAVNVGKTLNGEVALWIEGSQDRALMKPGEAYRLAQVLLLQLGMELPNMDGLK